MSNNIDIDIIVPYVDENDKAWQKDFNYYKEKEIKEGIQKESNKQAFAEERIRDWDAFKFWFRGVEKNCPWVHKVFLVVQRESQIPEWLNRDNPKLRIVYHDEFIPPEFLPTFSTLVIETFYYRIPDLSEYFIVSNDDFYFLNEIPKNLFFDYNEDKSKVNIIQGQTKMRTKNWACGNPDWESIIRNNNSFLEKYIIKKQVNEFYHYSHLPDGRVKSFETQFMEKYHDQIYKAMLVSKFRHPQNLIPSLLFIDSMKYLGYGILNERVYEKSKYTSININTSFNDYINCEMVCFNDTADVKDDFGMCKDNLLSFLNFKLPTPSFFEKFEDESVTHKNIINKELSICFGIISWLPDKERDRNQRIERLNNTFEQIVNIFGPEVNFMVVAQNWKQYTPPEFVKNIQIDKEPKLGILGARKTLRKLFLQSNYDYLIMLDDDIVLELNKGFTPEYFLKELNEHPNGFMFLQYSWSLTFCAISKYIYEKEPMPNINPEKGEGYEDVIFPYLLRFKYPKNEFHIYGLKFLQHKGEYKKDCKSTWDDNSVNHKRLHKFTDYYLARFKRGIFTIDDKVKEEARVSVDRQDWIEKALYYGWINKEDVDKFYN